MSMNWLTAKNENNLALSSVKLDFTLVKLEAPKEFNGLGAALAQNRKTNAEDGESHRTARKLGALFEQIIPSTPRLITIYGERVSEIMKTPGANPKGHEKHGPFEPFIGADATALWAAATSGISSIAMYLLAALLADQFDHKAAISIWVEIIEERKKCIIDGLNNNSIVLESSIIAARQDITREELALWDSSARAWAEIADQVKKKERSQFLLISKNISLLKPQGANTYQKVLYLWHGAMKGMEELLQGRPQSITDCCITSAVSAWHLFPDLLVLGGEIANISFNDRLVPKSATCTIGLASPTETSDRPSNNWSLSLSHYRYYGDPFEATSEDTSRVTFPQLLIVVLGSVFGHWLVPRGDIVAAAHWILELNLFLNNNPAPPGCRTINGKPWLDCLVEGAKHFTSAGGLEDATAARLIRFGMRRGKEFLVSQGQHPLPFFGLRSRMVHLSLQASSDLECGVTFMRAYAKDIGLTNAKALIVIQHPDAHSVLLSRATFVEFASIGRIASARGPKRTLDGSHTVSSSYSRLLVHQDSLNDPMKSYKDAITDYPIMLRRQEEIIERGEMLLDWHVDDDFQLLAKLFALEKAPYGFIISPTGRSFELVIGDFSVGLFTYKPFSMPFAETKAKFSRDDFARFNIPLKIEMLNPDRLRTFIWSRPSLDITSPYTIRPLSSGVRAVADYCFGDFKIQTSLLGLYLASKIFKFLDGSTISLQLVTSGECLATAGWICGQKGGFELNMWQGFDHYNLTRDQAFACLAHFALGKDILNPHMLNYTIALCMGNSIYVPQALLSDPFEITALFQLKRLVGNTGHSGLTILVSPPQIKTRKLSDCYNLTEHKVYDMKRENNFKSTSLHLSFTQWSLPVEHARSRSIDQDAHFVEAFISVRDRGEWVADLDISRINFEQLILLQEPPCHDDNHAKYYKEYQCIDTWEEFLDPPEDVSIFRAKGNWAARVAAVSMYVCLMNYAEPLVYHHYQWLTSKRSTNGLAD